MPKVGPFKAVDFKIPNQQTEDIYIASVNHTLDDYRSLLAKAGHNKLNLPDTDFDTGRPARAGEYSLADETYGHLLDQLAKKNFEQISPDLAASILSFYQNPIAPIATKKRGDWQKTQDEIEKLRTVVADKIPASQISIVE